jgi:hypothetical protein
MRSRKFIGSTIEVQDTLEETFGVIEREMGMCKWSGSMSNNVCYTV